MYKIYPDKPQRTHQVMLKFSRIMRLTILLLTITIVQVSAAGYAQKVSLDLRNASLSRVFREIRKQTDFDFLYNDKLIRDAKPINIKVRNLDIRQVMEKCLSEQNLSFSISDKAISIQARQVRPPEKTAAVQYKVVSGTVLMEGGMPLPRVVIREKQTPKNQTITDSNGRFSLTVAGDESILVFTYVGYETYQIKAAEIKSSFSVTLKQKMNDLDQIQITAYGTTTKRLNAGNITTITAKDIEKHPVNNVLEALQGKVPGLFIQQVTGQPGGAFNVRMRGSSNFNTGATEPLVIVDGVRYPSGALPLSGNTLYATANFLQGGSGLNYLNPNDIERIDVLKDIDATAIYGSSGAYGVILITTKKAKNVSPTFSANVYTGVSVKGKLVPILNTEEYVMLRREAITNDNLQPTAADRDINGTWPADRYTDWRKELIGNSAATTNANFSYGGGSGNVSYLLGGSIRDVGNIQRHNGSNRDGTVRFSLTSTTADNKLILSLSGNYVSSKNDMVPYDFSGFASVAPPNAPNPFNPDGSINWDNLTANSVGNATPAEMFRTYDNQTNNLLANFTATYKPTSKITLRSVFAYNNISGRESVGYPSAAFHPATVNVSNSLVGILNQYNTRSITVSPYAEYRTTVAKKGDLTVIFGGEINNQLRNATEIRGNGFASDALIANPSLGASVATTNSLADYRSIGMYGIVKFVWNNKYIVDINTRRDGSIKFGPGRRFGNFGSAALAWVFTEEDLLKDLSWLSFGKLRASSGIVGGDAITPFQYLGTYSTITGTYDGKTGLIPSALANEYLEWEHNFNSEVALELAFFNNRISAEYSYYSNRSSNQLLSRPLSSVTGYSSYVLNSDALIRTSGSEIMLSSNNIKAKHFNWSTTINVSVPKSKILRLPSQANQNSNYVLNKPVTGKLLYKYNGVNPETGQYNFTNAKGESGDFMTGLTQADKTEFIDLSPKYFGGFQNSFSYKQLTLDVAFSFTSRMAQSYLGQQSLVFGLPEFGGSTIWLDRWQKKGDNAKVPKLTSQITGSLRHWVFQESTGAYEDATYARLQNVSLRYSLSQELVKKLKLRSLSLYLQGQNLATISKFGGLDPENLQGSVLPPMRVFTAGFNLTL